MSLSIAARMLLSIAAPALAVLSIAAPALAADPSPFAAPLKDAAPASRSAASPQDDKAQRIKRAQGLTDEALDLYERGEYRAAIAKLEAATELDPDGAELAYNLGLIHERLGELDLAEKYYRRDLELEADPKLRERAQGILKRLEGAKKQMPVKVVGPAAPLPPDRPPPPRRVGPGVIISSSIAGAALISAAGFGIGALVKNPGADAKTRPGYGVGDIQADASRAHGLAIVSDISWIGFAVASSAAILFYVATPRPAQAAPPNRRAGSRVELDVGAGRAALRVVF